MKRAMESFCYGREVPLSIPQKGGITMCFRSTHVAGIALIVLLACIAPSAGQTAFTYSGRPVIKGRPANGNYDFRFTLFDAPSGGNEVARRWSARMYRYLRATTLSPWTSAPTLSPGRRIMASDCSIAWKLRRTGSWMKASRS